MALKRTFMIGVMLVCGTLASVAWGQSSNNTPSDFFQRTPEDAADLPFQTPGRIDYDAQLFAPLEFTNGKEPKPNCGFSLAVDRSYISLDRGTRFDSNTGQQSSNGSEFNWGTNYEADYFGENDKGWNARFDNLTGSFFTNGNDPAASNPTAVEQKFATVQINRIFRQNVSHGGLFEPFFGGRYMNLSDTAIQDVGTNRFRQFVGNSTVGVQSGARYILRRGHWRFTTRGAVAATYNQQRYETQNIDSGPIAGQRVATNQTNFSDQSFVPVLDGSFDASYHISRDLSVKLGVTGIYSWDGIARVNTETSALNGLSGIGTGTIFRPLDENLVAVGFRFGVEWRR